MKRVVFKVIIGTIIAAMMLLSYVSFADVGNFESYDSDWGSDSSWDSSWDSDWGSDWGSDSSWDSDWNSDSNWGSSDDSYSTSDTVIGTIVVLAIIAVIIYKKSNKNNLGVNQNANNFSNIQKEEATRSEYGVIAQIHKVDEFFNEEKFLAWSKNLFVKLQSAWTARDWETIRTFETEALFEQHSTQIKQYVENKQINIMDRISVNYAKLDGFSQDNDKDTIKVLLQSSMVDYIINEETKEIVNGDKTTRRTRKYIMTFIRKKGVKTKEGTDEVKTTNCPNCGAPSEVTSSGKCKYCGSVFTTGDHDWALSNLEPYRG